MGHFRRARFRRALVAGLAVLTVVGGLSQARADPAPSVMGQTPPTTMNPIEALLKGILTPTTVPAPPPAGPAPGEPVVGDPAAPPTDPDTLVGDPSTPQSISPDLQALIDSVQRTGGRTTLPLMDQLRLLKDVGFTEEEAAQIGMGHFPVGGEATYRDDFYEYRAGPPVHAHQGNDIFANRGTPVRASFPGTVSFSEGGLGGKMYFLSGDDGNTYFGAHLDTFAEDVPSGSRVDQGQVIGTVGDSGNAVGGSPHLHFEVQPGGGASINPKPILDGWIDEAIANVPAILAPYFEQGAAGIPRALTDAGLLRRFDRPASSGSSQISALWASSMSPDTGALNLEKLQAAQANGQVNWEQVAALQQALDDAWDQARELSQAVLSPVMPQPVAALLIGAPS